MKNPREAWKFVFLFDLFLNENNNVLEGKGSALLSSP